MIVFDLQAVQSVDHSERGIARFVGELAAAMERRHPGLVDVYALNEQMPVPARLQGMGLGDRTRSYADLRGRRVDLLHVNSPFESPDVGSITAPVRPSSTVVTCFDLIPYRFPHVYLTNGRGRSRYVSRLGMLLGADRIVTDSDSAADDTAALLGFDRNKITTIGAGTGRQFALPVDSLAERMALLTERFADLRAGFVLVPAGPDWRKNVEGAVAAYARLDTATRRDHQLVVASRFDASQRRRLNDWCAEQGVADDVLITGLVSDDELVRLYQSAALVFFPSIYEGFGLPVLEARRCGAPVICSNTASLPEVLTDPRATFNPHDVGEMAEALDTALHSVVAAAILERVPDPGFTWDLAADRLATVYRELQPTASARAARVERERRPTVAVVILSQSAWLPEGMVALLSALHEVVDVSLYAHELIGHYTVDWPFAVAGVRTLVAAHAIGDVDHVIAYVSAEEARRVGIPVLDMVPHHVLFDLDRSDLDERELLHRRACALAAAARAAEDAEEVGDDREPDGATTSAARTGDEATGPADVGPRDPLRVLIDRAISVMTVRPDAGAWLFERYEVEAVPLAPEADDDDAWAPWAAATVLDVLTSSRVC